MEDEQKDEVITIKQSELSDLVKREMEKLSAPQTITTKRVTDHTAIIRIIDGDKIVIDFGRSWTEEKMTDLNPKAERRLFMEVVVANAQGERETKAVDWIDFMNEAPGRTVKIVNQRAEEKIVEQGMKSAENPDPVNNKTFRGFQVALNVIVPVYLVTIDFGNPLPGWKTAQVEIDSKALNI